MKNKKILITGAAGFIGTNLAKELSENNEVISLDIRKPKFGKPLIMNIADPKWIDKVGKVDYVFHLAATVGVKYVAEHPFETMNTEIYGINNIIQHAIKYRPKKIIYTSSSVVYGNIQRATEKSKFDTNSSYGVAKYLAEVYLKELKAKHNINYTIGRLFNVYGPYQNTRMVIPKFIEQAELNKNITIYGDGKQTRDFTYIADVVELLIAMTIFPEANGEVFNIGSGKPTNLSDLAKSIKELSDSKSKIIFKKSPKKIEKYDAIKERCCDNKKVVTTFNFKEWTPLAKGLKITILCMEYENRNIYSSRYK